MFDAAEDQAPEELRGPQVHDLELLAPAGDWSALEAALAAGAGAIYFGLTTLNARRRAKNFRQEDFAKAVETIHAHQARAYVTLNIDLTERELGQAARILELARQAGADAVLVRDPALLALKPEYPALEFHFSTQTCMTNSADVAAVGRLGASRVVLAREMTLAEIEAASSLPGVETEVFVQGALCFSVSGRCLLSSWAGGRSGNRGACTSPCRVPWNIDDTPAGTPLSMHDLAAVLRLEDLRQAGVAALKIEGRLKNAAWVRQAVGLYRRAIARAPGGLTDDLLREAEALGAYTGRAMTSGYLDGQRDDLTGVAGREALPAQTPSADDQEPTAEAEAVETSDSVFDFSMDIEDRGIICRCKHVDRSVEWVLPKTVVRRAHKAVPIGQVLELLTLGPIEGCEPRDLSTNNPDFLMVPRAVNALAARIAAALRQMRKGPSDQVRVAIPPSVQALLEKRPPHETNRHSLGDAPNRVRLHAKLVGAFVKGVQPEGLIVEGVTPALFERVQAAARDVPWIAALPQVFFEDDLPRIRKLLHLCKEARQTVEVNSWGGWRLARQAGVRMEAGPGLPVLNSLAAHVLREAGVRCVTISPEADRRQIEELTACCNVPCSLVVFGRPPLLTTRVHLPEESLGRVFEDRRGVRLLPEIEQGLLVFRPETAFDLRDVRNERIRVRHLVVDLVRSPDPIGDWHDLPQGDRKVFRFNYDRSLA